MNTLKMTRWAAIVVGSLSAIMVPGGFLLGHMLQHGGYIAASSFYAGIALTCYLWWRESFTEGRTLTSHLMAFNFALMGGLALYANLSWALWAAGVPVDLGIVRDGRMGEHYWLGPFTLIFAVFCYAVLHWPKPTSRQ